MIFIILLLWTAVVLILLNRSDNTLGAGITIIAAICSGAAMLSYSYIGLGFLHIGYNISMIIASAIPLAVISFLLIKRGSLAGLTPANATSIPNKPLFIFFSALLLITIAFFACVKKWGAVDAISIWTLRARYLTVGNFPDCSLFGLPYTHPDYPLMLPSLISVAWRSLHTQSPVVPAIIAYLSCVGVLAVLFYSFYNKDNHRPAIAVTLLTTITFFYPIAFLQYADTLLALFILLPFILANETQKSSGFILACITGFLTCSCGWIKNEGLAFAAIFTCIYLIANRSNKKTIACFLAGTVVPFSVITIYKIQYVPANDLHLGQASLKLLSASRLLQVTQLFWGFILFKSQIPVLLAIAFIINRRYFRSWQFFVVAGILCCHFCVFLVTPYDVTWHINTSIDRLIHQLMPAFYYTLFINWRRQEKTGNIITLVEKLRKPEIDPKANLKELYYQDKLKK